MQQAQSKCKDIGVRLENAGDTTEQLNKSSREGGGQEQAESEIDFQIHRVVPEAVSYTHLTLPTKAKV